MAVGDISYDQGMPVRSGSRFVIRGTLEADTTLRAFAILDTKSSILSCKLTDEDGPNAVQCRLNENASAVVTNGTIAVDSGGTGTVRFEAEYV